MIQHKFGDDLKVNFGSGRTRIKDFLNFDGLPWDGTTDVIHDLTKFPYPFDDNSVSELVAIEVLEHISFRLIPELVRELHRIVKPGGKITVQVPDCGSMMRFYVEGRICTCVENKPINDAEGYGKADCELCAGRGKVNPERWMVAFAGAQKHKYDAHLNQFTKESLNKIFRKGWKIKWTDDPRGWKLKMTATKRVPVIKE